MKGRLVLLYKSEKEENLFLDCMVGGCTTDWSFLPPEAIFIRCLLYFAFNYVYVYWAGEWSGHVNELTENCH